MERIFILILSISIIQVHGQDCETFDRDLFHFLPTELPDIINCVDKNGEKQGWWLQYEVKYNPVDRPDELKKGNYVERYSYGQYKDNRKFGTWKSVENVHLVYESRVDSFYYSEDSTVVISNYMDDGWYETKTYYNSDSTVIRYTHFLRQVADPILIECNKNLPTEKQCHMTFGEKEKVFPLERRHIEVELAIMEHNGVIRRNE